MTPHVGFLAELPVRAILDGELVAMDGDGKPDFPLICERLLQHRFSIPLTFMVFDVLSVDGQSVVSHPYAERRLILEDLQLDARQWRTHRRSTAARPWGGRVRARTQVVVARWRASRYVPGGARLDQDEEPRLLAVRDGARGRFEGSPRAAVHLAAASAKDDSSLADASCFFSTLVCQVAVLFAPKPLRMWPCK